MNGITFGAYIIFLKRYMKHAYNQIWSIRYSVIHAMKSGASEAINRENWMAINGELDNISITIEDEHLNAIIGGNQAQVDKIFARIERYSKIITEPAFLNFADLTQELKYDR